MSTTPATPLIQAHFGGFLFYSSMHYSEPCLTIDHQITLLTDKGLKLTDPAALIPPLSHIGYFHLNKYMKYFLRDGKFEESMQASEILDLYYDDKFLRSIIFDAIETIEIALRAVINDVMGCSYGSHLPPAWMTLEICSLGTLSMLYDAILPTAART